MAGWSAIESVRRPGRDPFVEPEPAADHPVPLRTPPFDPVHVGEDRPAPRPEIGQEDRRVVAEHEAQAVAAGCIERAPPVEIERRRRALCGDLDVDELDPPPKLGPQAAAHDLDLMLAINRDMPALPDQKQAEVLCECLESPVSGRDAARAQNDHGSSGRHRRSLSLHIPGLDYPLRRSRHRQPIPQSYSGGACLDDDSPAVVNRGPWGLRRLRHASVRPSPVRGVEPPSPAIVSPSPSGSGREGAPTRRADFGDATHSSGNDRRFHRAMLTGLLRLDVFCTQQFDFRSSVIWINGGLSGIQSLRSDAG